MNDLSFERTPSGKLTHISKVSPCYHIDFVADGYRIGYSIQDAFLSLFSFHNQSMNVWSHLIGFFCVIFIFIEFIFQEFASTLSLHDYLVFQIYLICAAMCLLLSAIYHLFSCVSENSHANLLKLDLTGVAFLVGGSFFIGTYFGFYCSPAAQYLNLSISVLVLIAGIYAPWINNKKLIPFAFASIVAFGLIPFAHWLWITPPVYRSQLFLGFLLMFFFYTLGFGFYISNVPERFFPNNWFATHLLPSHTLWHLCVLGAAYCWWDYALDYRRLLQEMGCDAYDQQGHLSLSHHGPPPTSLFSLQPFDGFLFSVLQGLGLGLGFSTVGHNNQTSASEL